MSDRHDELEAELLTLRRRMRRLTATNVLLTVAVLAFGGAGAAYAVAAANSVNSASIIDGSITTPDLKTGALSGSKILDGSVTSADVANNSLTGDDINEGTLTLPTTAPSGSKFFGRFRATAGDSSSPGSTVAGSAISFPFAFSSDPGFNFVAVGATGSADKCLSGTSATPKAAPGEICFYSTTLTNFSGATAVHSVFGADITSSSATTGPLSVAAVWAATAP